MPAARAAAATAMMLASTTASFTRHPAGGTRPVQAAWTAGARGSSLPHDLETPAAPSGARRCREPAIHDSEVARSETIDLKAEGASFAFGYGGPNGRSLGKVYGNRSSSSAKPGSSKGRPASLPGQGTAGQSGYEEVRDGRNGLPAQSRRAKRSVRTVPMTSAGYPRRS